MKEKAPLWVLGSVLFLGIIGGVFQAPSAFAGDDKVETLNMSLDGGAAVVCTTNRLFTGKQYAVQPSVAAYVNTSPTNDGGVGVVDSNDTLIAAGKLYDIWPTNDRRYICCKPVANGSASTCNVKIYREY